jgi:hypothetical protein
MGSATRHRQAFLNEHPICAFCGGGAPSTTIEHCPPRAMFQHRQWPEGFEFPACAACNHGSDDHDLLVSMLARMDPFENKGNLDGKAPGLMAAAHRQYPGLFRKMMPTPIEARRQNRALGIRPAPGQTHQDTCVMKIPDEMHQAVGVLARKLAKAIYYRDVQAIFPEDGCLMLTWFTNTDLVRDGKYPVFETLRDMAGTAPTLTRSGRFLNDQFEYKVSLSAEQHLLALQARFGNAFGLVVFGSTSPGLIEKHVDRLQETHPRDDDGPGPFTILQSATLPLGPAADECRGSCDLTADRCREPKVLSTDSSLQVLPVGEVRCDGHRKSIPTG